MAARTVNAHRRIQIFLSLLLCVLTWRGPVPMLHHHEEFAGDTAAIQTHEAVFHPGSPGKDLQEWHWHFVVPAALPVGDPLSHRTSCPSDVMCLACALAVCSEAGAMSCDLWHSFISLPGSADNRLTAVPSHGRNQRGDLERECPFRTCLRLTGVLLI